MMREQYHVSKPLLVFILSLAVAGCGGDRMNDVTDAKGALTDARFSTDEKARLVDRMAAEAAPERRRELLKEIVWKTSNGYRTRMRAVELLVDDPADPNGANTRAMLRLLIGPEPDAGLVAGVGEIAATRGWTDLTPALIRQLSRQRIATDDTKRSEWIHLQKLHPGKSLIEIAFEVFVAPSASGLAADRVEREREGAWQLLSRLDKDGSKRRAMLGSLADNPTPALVDIQACARDLGAVPLTASELSWLRHLRRPQNTPWWNESAAAVAKLSPASREGLALRHIEAVRWSSANQPSWLSMGRSELLSVLQQRLKGRTLHLRSDVGGDSGKGSERIADNEPRMNWADLLALLVIDTAAQSPGLAGTLWQQALDDQKDNTTEYGGFISSNGAGFRASLYPPRPTQRFGDNRFIASEDLLADGATGLVVYHFHAQRTVNTEYAGPSGGDIEYARDSGRLCVVFTPVKQGVFNVDAYFGDGLRCDLGTIGQSAVP